VLALQLNETLTIVTIPTVERYVVVCMLVLSSVSDLALYGFSIEANENHKSAALQIDA